jgi:phosphoserine aminotransferase
MKRVYNFCAGPAALPEAVLQQAQKDILNWNDTGMSIMEMSHRSSEFVSVADEAEQDLRDLMKIPDSYKVLFMQGGASSQFASIPLNLGQKTGKADYLNTGQWSKKAIKEAKKFVDVNVVASSEDENFTTVPDVSDWALNSDASYLHYTPNETIGGVEMSTPPKVNVPLVADMSSTILSREINVSDFGVIYAGAQKNIGPAGLTIVIIDENLLGDASDNTPSMLNYQTISDASSMYNTPPTYSIYLAGLVFKWLKSKGGVSAIEEVNLRKAKKLYDFIDQSSFYSNPVENKYRSIMNVPFILRDSDLDQFFLTQAQSKGLTNLKGHRSVGGMRASIYNAVSEEAVDALIGFMSDFEKNNSAA